MIAILKSRNAGKVLYYRGNKDWTIDIRQACVFADLDQVKDFLGTKFYAEAIENMQDVGTWEVYDEPVLCTNLDMNDMWKQERIVKLRNELELLEGVKPPFSPPSIDGILVKL